MLGALLAGTGTSLGAQGATVSGVLAHGSRGGVPLAGRWVVLHQITMQAGAPIDSVRSDAAGRWRLRVPRVDTLAVYVVSAFRDDIAYFTQPIRVVAGTATTADTLVVYDTSSSGPPIRVRRRLVTIARPKADGTRAVLEILELENPGRATRLAPDSLLPTWTGAIPPAALQFQVGTGDFSADAVLRTGDRVQLFGPIQPDVPRQLTYGYELPGTLRTLALPIDQPTAELNLLIEDTLAVVFAPGLDSGGVQRIEERDFARYRAESLAAAAPVAITFSAASFRPEALLPGLVGAIAVALGLGLWIALRRSRQPSSLRT